MFEDQFVARSTAALGKTHLGDVPQTVLNNVFPAFMRKFKQKIPDTKTEVFVKVAEHGVIVNSKPSNTLENTIFSFSYAQVADCKGRAIKEECANYDLITDGGLKSVALCATNRKTVYRIAELAEIRASIYVNCLENKLVTLFDENKLEEILAVPNISVLKAADLALEQCETEKSVFELDNYLRKRCSEGNLEYINKIQEIRRKIKDSWFRFKAKLQEEVFISEWSTVVSRQFSGWQMNSEQIKRLINEIRVVVDSEKRSTYLLRLIEEILQNEEFNGRIEDINTFPDQKSRIKLVLEAYWKVFRKFESISFLRKHISPEQIVLLARLNSESLAEAVSKLPGFSQISQEINKIRRNDLFLDFYGLNSILQSVKSFTYNGKLLKDV